MRLKLTVFAAVLVGAWGLTALPALASTPTLAVGNTSAVESATTVNFTVVLSHTIAHRAYFDFKTVDGTARAGKDYVSTSGRTFVAIGATKRVIKVSLVHDLKAEPTEAFSLRISNPTRATISDGSGKATIRDDDGPIVNEVFASPADHLSNEKWAELYNPTAATLNLAGWNLVVGASTCPLTGTVAAHGYYVIARTSDATANGGLPAPQTTCAGLSPSVTGGLLQVKNPGGVVVDTFAYGTSNGGSIQAHDGASLNLDPSFATASGNDVTDHWCDATTAYGTAGSLGTPDALNTACP